MVLSPELELRQGQQLVMTPQLQQAIRLLQLSNIELCSFIETELERNPLLEREEGPTEGMSAPTPSEGSQAEEDREGEWADRYPEAVGLGPVIHRQAAAPEAEGGGGVGGHQA